MCQHSNETRQDKGLSTGSIVPAVNSVEDTCIYDFLRSERSERIDTAGYVRTLKLLNGK